MILADASIWVDHLRSRSRLFEDLLDVRAVLMHPFVMGELALGNLPDRQRTLRYFNELPPAATASHAEVMLLLEANDLVGKGIGYVDLHLLAAARLIPEVRLWTRDRRLAELAEAFGVRFAAGTTWI